MASFVDKYTRNPSADLMPRANDGAPVNRLEPYMKKAPEKTALSVGDNPEDTEKHRRAVRPSRHKPNIAQVIRGLNRAEMLVKRGDPRDREEIARLLAGAKQELGAAPSRHDPHHPHDEEHHGDVHGSDGHAHHHHAHQVEGHVDRLKDEHHHQENEHINKR